MKKRYAPLLFLISFTSFSQIKGTVSDEKGIPLPFVSVIIQNSYSGTTTNEKGKYELNLKKEGDYTLLFQFLGFKTVKKTVHYDKSPIEIDIQLLEENYNLNEVIINPKNNLANTIIKSAIATRRENAEKTARFTADFYSRGLFKIKNLPKKILGMKIEMSDEMTSGLDSTGSGILYLSETVSKLTFEKPNNYKEKIIASKISGNDKGFSYNTARSSFYDFYDNTVDFNVKMISPIASNAFQYYKYKLESTFFDESNHQINKIKVIPKRDKEPVFEGYLYIVEDSWAIYAVDFDIKGYRNRNEFTEVMTLKQNFNYNASTKIWSKNAQSLAFTAGAFGIGFSGTFNYVYSNYEFFDAFDKKTFGNEIVSFENNANKKEDIFWKSTRPIPLTEEESKDYIKKDSIQTKRSSKTFLDSIDQKRNKFKLLDPITGYNYRNTFKKWSFDYAGLLDVRSLNFNTVQGWNLDSGFTYRKWDDESGKSTAIATTFNYGFSDKRFRLVGNFSHRFNNQNYATIWVSGGTTVKQFNENNPISPFINNISTLFFKNNFMKLYNKDFFNVVYSQNIANGINISGKLEYSRRKPLFNTTNYTFIKNNDFYSSNNPLDPNDDSTSCFTTHQLIKTNFNWRINFGSKYISRPDGKFNLRNEQYPTVFIGYENAFAASHKDYEYDFISARVLYDLPLANKGDLGVNFRVGKFFNAENIGFMDYKHFNANQTRIGQTDRYLNVFNLLPYYSHSTNDAYFEIHSEYSDNGFIMNKIPGLNLLKSNLMLGFHNLAIPNRKPYQEVSIGLDNLGLGKFKQFRVDYVRSYQNGFQGDGVIFGLKLLNILD